MEQRKNAADRVRPILAMMERSIDAARRERTQDDSAERLTSPTTHASSQGSAGSATNRPTVLPQRPTIAPQATFGTGVAPSTSSLRPQNHPSTPSHGNAGSSDRERLKARPKRPAAFLNERSFPDQNKNYHSRAV